ncbi:MAG: Xenobiotic-transporting ATPase [Gemmatimonas sp. SG8_23]|nr:MAG: Xenobiotic-transporting ATPase [Gemmatimonas sp. SG8_23]
MSEQTSRASDLRLFARVIGETRRYWPHVIGLFLLGLLSTPLALLGPVPLKIAVDSVLGTDPVPGVLQPIIPTGVQASPDRLLVFAAALMVVLALLVQLHSVALSYLRSYTSEKVVLEFRGRLFRHAQRLSLAYHDRIGTSDAIYRIQYDTNAIQYIAIDGVIPFVSAVVTLVAMFWVSARIDLLLVLAAVSITPLLLLYTAVYRRHVRHKYSELARIESSGLSVVQEVLTSLRVVKAFGQEDREQERFVRHYERGLMARLRLLLADGGLSTMTGLTTAAATAAVLFLGVRHVQTGVLSLGDLLLVMAYLSQLHGPITTVSSRAAGLQSMLAGAERAMALLDRMPDVVERPNAKKIQRARGDLAFQNVSFAYPDGPLVLEDVSFELEAGTKLGIAGRTGIGKSTLVSLATRFYDPTDGAVLLDGVDLRDYRLADLREQFGIVLQDSVLFSTTVADNIAYAKPDATLDEIEAAARAANAHDFIIRLENGYDTPVGERGLSLSGGERQRIALARAFLKDAPILILDEPTSSVDVGTESLIMDAMTRLMRGRTTIMIAHRLSTLEDCDQFLLLERGPGSAGRIRRVEQLTGELVRQS